MPWKKLLANVTDAIDEDLRLRKEDLVTENRILRSTRKKRRTAWTRHNRQGARKKSTPNCRDDHQT